MTPPDRRRGEVLEALRRLADEGGRRAADAMGRLLGRATAVDEVRSLEGPDAAGIARMVGRPGQDLVAIGMEMQEPLGGLLVLFPSADEAERLTQQLVPDAAAGSLDVVGESALVEMGNIAGSAFVSALAGRIQARLLHGVPRCKYCMVACPYGARSFNYKTQETKAYHRQDEPPDRKSWDPWPFPVRTQGVVEKCTFCFHRIDQGLKEGKKIGTEVVPACVEACPSHARVFGDLDDLQSPVVQLLASRASFRLREELATHPKVIYLSR